MDNMTDKVKAVRDTLRDLGVRVRVNNRKLRHRKKTYLHIATTGGHYECFNIFLPIIRQYFPDAYVTSGYFANRIDVTIALEK